MFDPQNKTDRPDVEEGHDHGQSDWSDDPKKRQYYYDDAHGYQNYDPEDDAEDEAE